MKQIKRKKGFTLLEVLITVAIVGILVAIAIPAVRNYVQRLRQKELNSKAEIIYNAVQNEMSRLKMAGQDQMYQPGTEGVGEVPSVPSDDDKYYDLNDDGEFEEDRQLYYILSPAEGEELTGIAVNLMNDNVVDAELLNHQWVIEFDPTSALVYAVFYSEDEEKKINELYVSDYSDGQNVNVNYRGDGGYTGVGYYGGGGDLSSAVTHNLKLTVSVENSDELLLKIRCVRPAKVTDHPVIRMTLTDALGHSFSECFSVDPNSTIVWVDNEDNGGEEITYKNSQLEVSGRAYEKTVTLDSLTAGHRFVDLYGRRADMSAGVMPEAYPGVPKTEDQILVPGTDLTIQVEACCPNNILVARKTLERTTNSLFADPEKTVPGSEEAATEEPFTAGELTAKISNPRHLQNLDASSGVAANVTQAVIASELHLEPMEYVDKSFAKTYTAEGNAYFNGVDGSRVRFKPICNDHLVTVKGEVPNMDNNGQIVDYDPATITGLYVVPVKVGDRTDTDLGLFGKVNFSENPAGLLEIKDITLTGETVASADGSSNAGGLVGIVSGNGTLSISGVQTYLLRSEVTAKKEKQNEKLYTIVGGNAGGLVGNVGSNATVKFKQSSASVLVGDINGTSVAGGLVGRVNNGSVDIQESYADCYIYAKDYGSGLVGSKSGLTGAIDLVNCYASGFIFTEKTSAGLVCGTVRNAKNVYTVVASGTGTKQKIGNSTISYGTATEFSSTSGVSKVYYANGAIGTLDAGSNISALFGGKNIQKVPTPLLPGDLSNVFTTETGSGYAYNYQVDGLTTYIYPILKKDASSVLSHYGDWGADFNEGSLVYYEKYRDANGSISFGFEGANVSTTLRNSPDYAVLGDGYGLVYSKSLADSFLADKNTSKGSASVEMDFTVNGKLPYTIEFKDYVEFTKELEEGALCYYPVKDGSSEYALYPIPDMTAYPERSGFKRDAGDLFYRVAITENINKASALGDDVNKTRYYFYQPDYAMTLIALEGNKDAEPPKVTAQTQFSVRTARQLYDMSRYYDLYESVLTLERGNVTFMQEREIDYATYDWDGFTGHEAETGKYIAEQQPIGNTEATAFTGIYDGGCNRIKNLSFASTPQSNQHYVGLFGYNKGTLRNIVLDDENNVRYVKNRSKVTTGVKVYMGILAGYNAGDIYNCACNGYTMEGDDPSDPTITATSTSSLYLGCLVGYNGSAVVQGTNRSGTIYNCSVVSPNLRITANYARVNLGGFVGYNVSGGVIDSCYDIAFLNVVQSNGGIVNVGGFTAHNEGRISNSYCATALSTSGSSVGYGFAPRGGSVSGSYYLNGGTFSFMGEVHDYTVSTVSTGTPVNYSELTKLRRSSTRADAEHCFSYDPALRHEDEEGFNFDGFPYPAYVKDASGKPVHYGNWQDILSLGSVGVFYWEQEEGSSANVGYHFSYIGVDVTTDTSTGESKTKISQGNSLCNVHDDGNVITEYGYGIYYKDNGGDCELTWSDDFDCSLTSLKGSISSDAYNAPASAAFETQMANSGKGDENLVFYAITTTGRDRLKRDANGDLEIKYTLSGRGKVNVQNVVTEELSEITDYLYLKTDALQSDVTIHYKGIDYRFTISPFFADAFSYNSEDSSAESAAEAKYGSSSKVNRELGTASAPYGVRSYDQLKYINWNSTLHVTDFNFREADIQVKTEEQEENETAFGAFKHYPYLDQAGLCWVQSHDLEADDATLPFASRKSFVPIGQFGEPFKGSYNGGGYRVKNLYIKSSAQAVGLFGRVQGGSVSNVIMMADAGRGLIECNYKSEYAATVGALIGLAKNSGTIYNCATSGYQVRYVGNKNEGSDRDDNKIFNTYGWRYNSPIIIGGLVGAAYNSTISNCSAVNTLTAAGEISSVRTEIGGLVGTIGSTNGAGVSVTNSYSGGTIADCGSKRALFGGIVANARGMDVDTVQDWISNSFQARNVNWPWYIYGPNGRSITISNCYTYCDVPASHGTYRFADLSGLTELWAAARGVLGQIIQDAEGLFRIDRDPLDAPFYQEGRLPDILSIFFRFFTGRADMTQNNLSGKYFYIAGNAGDEDPNAIIGDPITTININNCYYFSRSADLLDAYDNEEIPEKDWILANSFELERVSLDEMTITDDNQGDTAFLLAKLRKNGGAWSRVTTVVGDVTDSGAFTYPTNAGLIGLDYPFPSIVTQAGRHVHYGDWVSEDPYWETAMNVLDVFAEENFDPAAPTVVSKTYFLKDDKKQLQEVFEDLNASNFTIEPADDPSIEITKVLAAEHEGHFGYEVTVNALKEGTTVIYPAGFQFSRLSVDVIVDLHVTVALFPKAPEEGEEPDAMIYTSSLTMNLTAAESGDQVEDRFALRVTDSNGIDEEGNGKDFTPYVSWKFVSDDTKDKSNPYADVTLDRTPETENDVANVIGYGRSTIYRVEATYPYNGKDYKGTAFLTVNTDVPSTVGISNNVNAFEGAPENSFVRMRTTHNGETDPAELTGQPGYPAKFAAPHYQGADDPELFLFFMQGNVDLEDIVIDSVELTGKYQGKDAKFRVYADGDELFTLEEGVVPLALRLDREGAVDDAARYKDVPLYLSVIEDSEIDPTELSELELTLKLKQNTEEASGECVYTLIAHPVVKSSVEMCTVMIRPYDQAAFVETLDAEHARNEKYRPLGDVKKLNAIKGLSFRLPERPEDFTNKYYDFNAWELGREADGKVTREAGKLYQVGDSVLIDEDIELYAYWQPKAFYAHLSLNDSMNMRTEQHISGLDGITTESEGIYKVPIVDDGLYTLDHFRLEFKSLAVDSWNNYKVCMWQPENGKAADRVSATKSLTDVTEEPTYVAVWQGKLTLNKDRANGWINFDGTPATATYYVIYGDSILNNRNLAAYIGSTDPDAPAYGGAYEFSYNHLNSAHKRSLAWEAKVYDDSGALTDPVDIFTLKGENNKVDFYAYSGYDSSRIYTAGKDAFALINGGKWVCPEGDFALYLRFDLAYEARLYADGGENTGNRYRNKATDEDGKEYYWDSFRLSTDPKKNHAYYDSPYSPKDEANVKLSRGGDKFVGWFVDEDLTVPLNDETRPSAVFDTSEVAHVDLFAKWQYVVNFDPNGGEFEESGSKIVTWISEITDPPQTRDFPVITKTPEGTDKLTAWTTRKDDLSTQQDMSVAKADSSKTYYAYYTTFPTVTFKANAAGESGGYVDGDRKIAQKTVGYDPETAPGSKVLPVAAKDNYDFIGWFAEADVAGEHPMTVNDIPTKVVEGVETVWVAHYKPWPVVKLDIGSATIEGNTGDFTRQSDGTYIWTGSWNTKTFKLPALENLKKNRIDFTDWDVAYDSFNQVKLSDLTFDADGIHATITATPENYYVLHLIAAVGGVPGKVDASAATGDDVEAVDDGALVYVSRYAGSKSLSKYLTKLDLSQYPYDFMGWYDAETGGTKCASVSTDDFESASPNELKLYARYLPMRKLTLYTTGDPIKDFEPVKDENGAYFKYFPRKEYGNTYAELPEATDSKHKVNFKGWSYSSDFSDPLEKAGTQIPLKTDEVKLYAKLLNVYTITFDFDGGVSSGSVCTDVKGVLTEKTYTNASTVTVDVEKDTDLVAKQTVDGKTLSFVPYVSTSEVTKRHYTLKNDTRWFLVAADAQPLGDKYPVTGDATFRVKWMPKKINLKLIDATHRIYNGTITDILSTKPTETTYANIPEVFVGNGLPDYTRPKPTKDQWALIGWYRSDEIWKSTGWQNKPYISADGVVCREFPEDYNGEFELYAVWRRTLAKAVDSIAAGRTYFIANDNSTLSASSNRIAYWNGTSVKYATGVSSISSYNPTNFNIIEGLFNTIPYGSIRDVNGNSYDRGSLLGTYFEMSALSATAPIESFEWTAEPGDNGGFHMKNGTGGYLRQDQPNGNILTVEENVIDKDGFDWIRNNALKYVYTVTHSFGPPTTETKKYTSFHCVDWGYKVEFANGNVTLSEGSVSAVESYVYELYDIYFYDYLG